VLADDAVFDAVRDAAVESEAALRYLKRRSYSLEEVFLAGSTPGGVA